MDEAKRAELRRAAELLGPVFVSASNGAGDDHILTLMRKNGPLFVGGSLTCGEDEPEIDAIAAAVNAFPALLDALEAAAKDRDALKAQLAEALAAAGRLRDAAYALFRRTEGYIHDDECARTEECDEREEGEECFRHGDEPCPSCECGHSGVQAARDDVAAALSSVPAGRTCGCRDGCLAADCDNGVGPSFAAEAAGRWLSEEEVGQVVEAIEALIYKPPNRSKDEDGVADKLRTALSLLRGEGK